MGSDGRGQRRAIQPPVSRRLVGRGRAAGCADKLEAVLDKPSYGPGETARLFVKAPFAGEAELAIASDRILSWRTLSLPADGTTIDIPVDAA